MPKMFELIKFSPYEWMTFYYLDGRNIDGIAHSKQEENVAVFRPATFAPSFLGLEYRCTSFDEAEQHLLNLLKIQDISTPIITSNERPTKKTNFGEHWIDKLPSFRTNPDLPWPKN